MKFGRYGFCALMVISLAACGGGGGGSGSTGAGNGSGSGTSYTIGGAISGLSASGLVLADNGGSNLTVSSGATSFIFATPLQSGATYDVTVATQPTGETCTVASATGTATSNVTSVAVTCKPFYTIGGTISGLSASGLVLADNGGDNLTVSSGASSFTFATPLQGGAAYNVTVATQPTGETCTVASATGMATSNVTSVAVTCKPLYTIGGTISGLSASGLVLADNGGDNLTVSSGASSFTFATPLQSGAAYDVTVTTQPTGETCSVAAGTGAGTATANVTSVAINCSVTTFTISGSITGLTNSGLKLQDYTGGEILAVSANASHFQFATPVPYGTSVGVTVAAQPFWQSCSAGASNFSGLITSNITTDTFGCTAAVASGAAVGTGVSFNSPAGVAVDTAGNLYVVDITGNAVYKIPPSGSASTLSISGLSSPQGIAVDPSGSTVYVANTGANTILEDAGGTVTRLAPSYTFNQPEGVAVDSSGNVYVADTGNNKIEKISTGGVVTVLGGTFTFNAPADVAVDSSGNVYVTDTNSNQVVEISGTTVTSLPGTYNGPYGVAVDSAGDVYVTDTNDHEVKMITAQGNAVIVAGSSVQGSCSASPPRFYQPYGIAVNAAGDLYVSDFLVSQVCELTPGP